MAGALAFAAPAQADPDLLTDVLSTLDSSETVALGQSLCPLLADRGQNTADLASKVSDAIGRPLGASTMFTGAAISFLCPKAVESVTDKLSNGLPLLPLFG